MLKACIAAYISHHAVIRTHIRNHPVSRKLRNDAPREGISDRQGPVLRWLGALALVPTLLLLAGCEDLHRFGPSESVDYQVALSTTNFPAQEEGPTDLTESVSGSTSVPVISPAVVKSVRLSMTSVAVYHLNSDTTGTDTTRHHDARWVELELPSDPHGTAEVELMDLSESGGMTLAAGSLPPGTYPALWLRLRGREIVLTDSIHLADPSGGSGAVYAPGAYDLTVPNGDASGVRLVNVQFALPDNSAKRTTIVLDMMASLESLRSTESGLAMEPVFTTASEAAAEDR